MKLTAKGIDKYKKKKQSMNKESEVWKKNNSNNKKTHTHTHTCAHKGGDRGHKRREGRERALVPKLQVTMVMIIREMPQQLVATNCNHDSQDAG